MPKTSSDQHLLPHLPIAGVQAFRVYSKLALPPTFPCRRSQTPPIDEDIDNCVVDGSASLSIITASPPPVVSLGMCASVTNVMN